MATSFAAIALKSDSWTFTGKVNGGLDATGLESVGVSGSLQSEF